MKNVILLTLFLILSLTSCQLSRKESNDKAKPEPDVELVVENSVEEKSPMDSIKIEKSENRNSFSFIITIEDFDTANHDVSKVREGLLNGKPFWGTDGDIPEKQIKDFSLTINRKLIYIEPELYKNFFNPNIGYMNGDIHMGAYWGKDFGSVFVFMNGSDGAGAYSVVWYLNKDGNHSYFVNHDDLYFKFNN